MPTSEGRKPAFVTGASRGIGAASAIALGQHGFDVAISARTIHEGEGREEDGGTLGIGTPLAGSLETTAAAIQAAGQRALLVPMDLVDREAVDAAARQVLDTWGVLDVLVNNGIYRGPGHNQPFLDTPMELIERTVEGDLFSQIVLLKRIVPAMIDSGGGIVINVTSMVAHMEPPGPIGKGGWGFAYAVAKGGFDRIAGLLNVEYHDRGIVAYNVEPGFVAYGERLEEMLRRYSNIPVSAPEEVGAAVAWLATSPDATRYVNRLIHGPQLCAKLGLL